MNVKNLGVIGYGVVGSAVGEVFKEKGHNVLWRTSSKGTPMKELCEQSEFIFICVPTPTNFETEKLDLSIMDSVVDELAPYVDDTDKLVVIKSTVPPGTTDGYSEKYPGIRFIFNPEFLTALNAKNDFENQDRIVIGGNNGEDVERLKQFYKETFVGVPIYTSRSKEAEMTKYMANLFLATKVIFANEFYDICSAWNIDYDTVKQMTSADFRIGKSHLNVTQDRGFSGMCFPKDICALRDYAHNDGIDVPLLDTVWHRNKEIRKKHDWGKI